MTQRNQVAERVQDLLVADGVGPGDRLPPERQLATELGLSRSTLREGLRRLVDLGIVEARQGSGTYVAALDIEDLIAARLRLEPYAAHLAAQRRTPEDVQRLDRMLGELRTQQNEPTAFAEVDARIHEAVTTASSSVALRVLLEALSDLLRQSRDTTAADPVVRAETVAALERLVRAIGERDAVAAERAMRGHLRDIRAATRRMRSPGQTASEGGAR